jgi:hypothetical protein
VEDRLEHTGTVRRVGVFGGERGQRRKGRRPGVRRAALDRGEKRRAERPEIRFGSANAIPGPFGRNVLR